jgi:uncharacterized phage infection (PIP) family protein YhgE
MAQRLVDVNKEIVESDLGTPSADHQSSLPDAPPPSEDPGLIDLLAKGEGAFPAVAEITAKIGTEMENFSRSVAGATREMKDSDQAERGFTGRLEVAKNLARSIAQPADHMLELANNYAAQMYDVDASVRTLISLAPQEIENDSDSKPMICTFFATMRTLAQSAEDMTAQMKEMAEALSQGESLSRDLRSPLQKIKQGIAILVEASGVTSEWVTAIESSPIKCDELSAPDLISHTS